MNEVGLRTRPKDQNCLMTLTGGEPVQYRNPMLLGGFSGCVVSSIAVSSSGKTAGLSLGASCGYTALGILAGVSCCVTSAVIHNKLCISPQESTDNQMPRGDIPLIADKLHLPSTQVITQQPGEVTPLPTPPVQSNIVHPPGTEFDPPPPYSDVVQMEDIYLPPPSYSEVIEQPAVG